MQNKQNVNYHMIGAMGEGNKQKRCLRDGLY